MIDHRPGAKFALVYIQKLGATKSLIKLAVLVCM